MTLQNNGCLRLTHRCSLTLFRVNLHFTTALSRSSSVVDLSKMRRRSYVLVGSFSELLRGQKKLSDGILCYIPPSLNVQYSEYYFEIEYPKRSIRKRLILRLRLDPTRHRKRASPILAIPFTKFDSTKKSSKTNPSLAQNITFSWKSRLILKSFSSTFRCSKRFANQKD